MSKQMVFPAKEGRRKRSVFMIQQFISQHTSYIKLLTFYYHLVPFQHSIGSFRGVPCDLDLGCWFGHHTQGLRCCGNYQERSTTVCKVSNNYTFLDIERATNPHVCFGHLIALSQSAPYSVVVQTSPDSAVVAETTLLNGLSSPSVDVRK